MADFTLKTALAHLVSFLTVPLAKILSEEHIDRVRTCLESTLYKEYEPTWQRDPRGSRSLALAPRPLPPRQLIAACHAGRLPWSQWMAVLGNEEMHVFVDPGCVSVRKASWGDRTHIIWAAPRRPVPDEAEVAELFSEIDREVRAPAPARTPGAAPWLGSMLLRFPPVPQHQRTASRASSDSSGSSQSCPSLVDADVLSSDSASGRSSAYIPPARRAGSYAHSASSDEDSPLPRRGERPAVRAARVHVDASKVDPTVYGRTTVLTGGTMLGMPALKRNSRIL